MASENPASKYNPSEIARHFDEEGLEEWNRLVATPVDEVSLHIHAHYLKDFVKIGQRVLEIGAGAGRFTQVLAGLGTRIVAADISPVQLELNRRHAQQYGFAGAVEAWQQADMCAMSMFGNAAFDCVVAYGGPFSYVLERRDNALRECLRVLKPGGLLLLSVMSMWGTAHMALGGVLALPPEINRGITDSGDLTAATFPGRKGNFMHMFRAEELRQWLMGAGLEILAMSASGVLATGWGDRLGEVRQDEKRWQELLRIELEASAEAASWNMGTHLIAVAQKP
jgi:SAM-dependent methyltransferase